MRLVAIAFIVSTLFTLVPARATSERLVTDFSGTALLGQIKTTQQLQRAFAVHDAQLAQAGSDIGLSPGQFDAVRAAIAAGRVRYVRLPQHIDAMSGESDGHIFAVRNIRIPPDVFGWEVDLDEGSDILKVYMPNRCGNISYVRTARPQVLSEAPVYHVSNPTRAMPGPFAPMALDVPAAPQAEDIAYSPNLSTPEIAQAASHHFALLPLILGGIITGFLASGGHGTGVTIGTHPTPIPSIAPSPTPTPVSCPTKVRRRIPK